MLKIELKIISKSKSEVMIGDNHIGDFVQDVDGFYYFVTDDYYGLWSGYELRMIADKLPSPGQVSDL